MHDVEREEVLKEDEVHGHGLGNESTGTLSSEESDDALLEAALRSVSSGAYLRNRVMINSNNTGPVKSNSSQVESTHISVHHHRIRKLAPRFC